MIKKCYLIAGGNPTVLIWDCTSEERLGVAEWYMRKVEQVGFVTVDNGLKKLAMMGNELCVDALLALAYDGQATGKFFALKVDGPITYKNNDTTTIRLHLPYERDGNTILFNGIGYSCTEHESEISKDAAAQLAKKYNLPAFGFVWFGDGKIIPHVYVAKTDSFVQESGCGSGSIAVNLVTGWETITQPSGETITVHQDDDAFEVTAKVTRQ